MSGIFISYRRDHTWLHAHNIHAALRPHFDVIMDVDAIGIGEDWGKVIRDAVGSCDALIAVISPQWLTATDEQGQRRLDNPDDWVRIEIGTALARGIRVIPTLVDEAAVPKADQLPADLAELPSRHAAKLDPGHWDYDLKQLIKRLEKPRRPKFARLRSFLAQRPRWVLWAAAVAAVAAMAIVVVVLIRDDDDSIIGGGGGEAVELVKVESAELGGPERQIIANVAGDGSSELVAVGSDGATDNRDPAVWHSTDAGASWNRADRASLASPRDALMNDVAALGDGTFVAVGHDGLRARAWLTADGAEWKQVSPPTPGGDYVMNAVTPSAGEVVAVGWTNGNGAAQDATAWRSTDGGRSWQLASVVDAQKGENQQMRDVVALDDENVVAVGYDNGTGDAMFWRSPDGGETWRSATKRDRFSTEQMAAVAAGDFGLVAVGSAETSEGLEAAVWRSTDDGESWERVSTEELKQTGNQRMLGVMASGEMLVAAGIDGGKVALWRSRDEGKTWERIKLRRQEEHSATSLASIDGELVVLGRGPGADFDAAVWTAQS